uniref:Uncharacterized protein n=1 Tax=Salix viminalis TaxID=40686 RepID=A0A6N2MQB4_SALVM
MCVLAVVSKTPDLRRFQGINSRMASFKFEAETMKGRAETLRDGSDIDRLPREIGQLTRLQLLDLTDNPTLEIIPPNVLSCLTQLEDLYMKNSFLQWGVEGLDDRRNNASLAELKICHI